MTCEEVQELLTTSSEEEMPSDVRDEIRHHIKDCPVCIAAEAETGHLWQLMGASSEAFPGPGLEKQFRQMLRTAEEEQKAARPVRPLILWRNIAAAVILLAAGIGIGIRLAPSGARSGQTVNTVVAAHHSDASDTLLFNLLNEESASERIKAVNYVEEMAAPNQRVIAALINTLDHDKNANVRLACLYSLARFSDNPKVRDALVSSLTHQTEPIVQIVLINLLTEMKESRARQPLQEIISNDKTSKEVKNIAEKGLRTM